MAITAKLAATPAYKAQMEEAEALTAKVGGTIAVGGGTAVVLTEVTIYSANWVGTGSPWSQVVSIDGVTPTSKVDLQTSVEQLETFHQKDLAFVAENEEGVVTIFAIGDKPANDYTIQATITEVKV